MGCSWGKWQNTETAGVSRGIPRNGQDKKRRRASCHAHGVRRLALGPPPVTTRQAEQVVSKSTSGSTSIRPPSTAAASLLDPAHPMRGRPRDTSLFITLVGIPSRSLLTSCSKRRRVTAGRVPVELEVTVPVHLPVPALRAVASLA
jgi:hypothetical protein